VLALKYPALEIIVVDQTPEHTPATRALLASVADHVRLIHQARPHVVTALNAGLAAARGEIVLFLDDDIRITDPDFVGAHAKNYDDPRVGGVAGRVIDARTRAEGRYDARSADPVFGFFHDPVSCDLKHPPRRYLPGRCWRLYRSHVLNRPYLVEGAGFVLHRHAAFVRGVSGAVATYARLPRAERYAVEASSTRLRR